MSGHVFIIQGDITKLACNAWLLPTDAGFGVTSGFWEGLTPEQQHALEELRGPERFTRALGAVTPLPAQGTSKTAGTALAGTSGA